MTSTNTSAPKPTLKRPYLYQVDVIRSTTFALVIFVHALTETTDMFGSIGVNATSLLLHFTRYTFFALTGFVLTYQYLGREDFTATSFWRRRMKLVIIPYIVWSVVYWVIIVMWGNGRFGEIPSSLDDFVERLGWGTAGFHLYFLLVMLQVYLLFPLLRWLIDRTRGHHWALLGCSLVLQLVILAVINWWTPPASWAGVWWHYYATLIPYQFFIILGAVGAANRDDVDLWMRRHGRWLVPALLVAMEIALACFLYSAIVHDDVFSNSSAFFLYLVPWLILAVVSMYALGRYWADNIRPHSPRQAYWASYASNRSFPVFLVHVLILFFLLRPQTDGQPTLLHYIPQPLATPIVYLLTIFLSLVLVEFLRRMPGSIYWTGRPRLPWRWVI